MSDQGIYPATPPISTAQAPVPLPDASVQVAATAAPAPAKPKASPKKAAAPAKPPAAKKAASPSKKAAPKKSVQTTVSCDQDLMDRIKARAEQEERTLSVVINRLLREAMKDWAPPSDDPTAPRGGSSWT